jgi:RNA polymerase II subunit A small phosphatase-like protein
MHASDAYANHQMHTQNALPGVSTFLERVGALYEIVVFTTGLEEYASDVIDKLDPKGFIQHRLYRQHARSIGTHLIKDLAALNRPLARTVLVDNRSVYLSL